MASQRNLAAALFRLENRRGPDTVREVVVALGEWLTNPDQEELRRSFLIWLREGFLQALLPTVAFPELNNLEEVRNMLTERVVAWTQQWKQEGWQEGRQESLNSERRLLLRLIRRRFGEVIAAQSAPALNQIEQLAVFEDLSEDLQLRGWRGMAGAVAGQGRQALGRKVHR